MRGLTICEICRISSSTFEIGRGVFVSEQGQKFHLTRFCRTFKSPPLTEYARCTAHVVQWNILRKFYLEIQYFAREGLLRQLLLLQVCQSTSFSGLEWDAMTFWIALH